MKKIRCASCPKMRTEPKSRIRGPFWKFAETSRRGTGSAIGAPEQTSPPDHPFRPAGTPELLCGGAVVITEQTAQSLTTSHLPVRTADAFFRVEQRVPKPLMVALSAIMEVATALPTADQNRLLPESHEKLDAQTSRLNRLVREALPALHDQLTQHGVSWTRGRPVRLPSLAPGTR